MRVGFSIVWIIEGLHYLNTAVELEVIADEHHDHNVQYISNTTDVTKPVDEAVNCAAMYHLISFYSEIHFSNSVFRRKRRKGVWVKELVIVKGFFLFLWEDTPWILLSKNIKFDPDTSITKLVTANRYRLSPCLTLKNWIIKIPKINFAIYQSEHLSFRF